MLLKAQAFCLSPPEVTSPLVAERLGMFIDTCKVLTGDLWVLQAVKGFKILFVSSTSQDTMPTKLVFPPEQEAQIKELRLLLEKEAIAPVTNSQGGFYLNLFGTQEEWSDEASNQPETVERVGNHRTFQYGRGLNPEGHPTIGGLVHEGRSERCLLHNSHRLWPPAVPEVYAGRGELPIYMLPFRPVLCPSHIYQSAEANDDTAWSWGVRIIVYINDMLILAETPEQASQHLETCYGYYKPWGLLSIKTSPCSLQPS